MAALDTEDQPFDRGPMTSLSSFPPVQLSLLLRFSNQRSPFLLITLTLSSSLPGHVLRSGPGFWPLCETYSRCLATVCLVASSTHCVFLNNLHSNLVKLNQKSNQTFCTFSAPWPDSHLHRPISTSIPQVRATHMFASVILKGHDTCSPLHLQYRQQT